ncbi:hypothetical protein PR202_ga18021 [Eleusine coracana subsp. coracana]|uniref:Hydrophobic seed protein domain-containing protein n=1 Tax=Eleusine coracana subsp. coracana TaxID=191504 RepID=A0AAV5CRE1_ELECO|nr:hypothetical protein PR202_ga18021 [Eleusine coracana subsp. coracana]
MVDTAKLEVCVDELGGLRPHAEIDDDAKAACCPLLMSGVVDADAAACLCAAIRARKLDVKVYLPVAANLLSACGNRPPRGFQCRPQLDATGKVVDHLQLPA